jgi:hypothetical protein
MSKILAIRFLGGRIAINGRPYNNGHIFGRGDLPGDSFEALSKRADFEVAERAPPPEKPKEKKPRVKKDVQKDEE